MRRWNLRRTHFFGFVTVSVAGVYNLYAFVTGGSWWLVFNALVGLACAYFAATSLHHYVVLRRTMLEVGRTWCPYCRRENDVHISVEGDGKLPEAGDVSLCFNCGLIGVFAGEAPRLSTRRPTLVELQQFMRNPGLMLGLSLIHGGDDLAEAAAIYWAKVSRYDN